MPTGSRFALAPAALADAALACETEELGITAGPMDRVIQAYEGVLFMDFAKPRAAGSLRRLDAARLPPLFVAWDPRGGAPSRKVHGDVRARYLAGDTELRRVIDELASLADDGLACLESETRAALAPLIERSTEVRARAFPLSERDRALLRIAREAGAAAKLCGSGGAVIGALRDDAAWPRLERRVRSCRLHARGRARVAEPRDAGSP